MDESVIKRRAVIRLDPARPEDMALIQVIKLVANSTTRANLARNLLLLGVRAGKKGL